ncbi:hypothetical protein ABAC460_04285 [Asticcacaulis sp. AC460]|uniref:peptidase domain-containing ABC transporter n=1 Tax=Asticcacaulis sp. AC460 TaxID=1282360 RepID=UPI0003C3B2CF|nr:peptidase domain-containing ABC transporter [Asticcacaulis sp. AC460]ESQ92110.1 hypothetical protein ABAC460_04285 [Asticcacaulis sp. AC460]
MMAAEQAECGLACVAMVAFYHGHDVDLNGLRNRYGFSMSGASFATLAKLAGDLCFMTRAMRIDVATLRQIALPAILHWDHNHFVVLRSITATRAVIHDPAKGRVEFSIDEFSTRFTGAVLEVRPRLPFSAIAARSPSGLRTLFAGLEGLKLKIPLILAFSVVLQAIAFAMPFQMQWIFDDVLGGGDANLLVIVCAGFAALTAAQTIVAGLRDWTVHILGNQMILQMINRIVGHLIRLPSDFFEKRHLGDILSRVDSARSIQQVVSQGLISSLIDGLMAITAAVAMWAYSPTLAALVFMSLTFVTALILFFFSRLRRATQRVIETSADEQTCLMETIRAATTVKLMGAEAQREAIWSALYDKAHGATHALGGLQVSMAFIQNTIIGLQSILVVFFGAKLVLAGTGFSAGMLITFMAFQQTLVSRTVALIAQTYQVRLLGMHLERLRDIVGQKKDDLSIAEDDIRDHGNLSLVDVSFRYGAGDDWVLNQIDLEVSQGEFLAITGPSGGGKSTLLKLLLGLYSPVQGTLCIDGRPVTHPLWRLWRQRVGVVSQDDRMLSGSLADNIAFFEPQKSMERVMRAAVAARIHDDIIRMPMSYQTKVGDMGSTLSAGQRQRVLLARALYREPQLLILDEGTANLDPATEAEIADTLRALPITRIVVAHRPALISRADRVMRLEDGRLYEDVEHSAKFPVLFASA